MKLPLLAVATFVLAVPAAVVAQIPMQTAHFTTPMSTQEVHSLIKSAHSGAQYKQLAGYFHDQEAENLAKAEVERIERNRRAQIHAALYQKFPRPVDSAQALYDSYMFDATHAAREAKRYDQLAGTKVVEEELPIAGSPVRQ